MRSVTNLLSTVKMYRFPASPPRRLQWEIALQRKNCKANPKSVFSNKHFIAVSSANIAKCDRSVCGISFTYRVNNRGELKLPCGRPLLIGRGEESALSTLTQ
ncbi:hypothetical protein TNCV_3029101 [Trichonephila clavipes]|nr:hypothetical protein TNCV_3029101 [Trichonephila clavipes]